MNGKLVPSFRLQSSTVDCYDSGSFTNAGEVVAANPCSLQGLIATNKGASVVYVQLFDSTSAPTGAPTYAPIAVPAGQTVSITWNDVIGSGLFGLPFAKGLTWGASSSAASYVADSADCWAQLRYMQ